MNKNVINWITIPVFLASVLILTLQGFAMLPISSLWQVVLRLLAGLSAQTFFIFNGKHPVLRSLPLIAGMLLALWGGCLFILSDSWANATMEQYLADYCTPVLGCLAAVALFQEQQRRF